MSEQTLKTFRHELKIRWSCFWPWLRHEELTFREHVRHVRWRRELDSGPPPDLSSTSPLSYPPIRSPRSGNAPVPHFHTSAMWSWRSWLVACPNNNNTLCPWVFLQKMQTCDTMNKTVCRLFKKRKYCDFVVMWKSPDTVSTQCDCRHD